MSLPDPMTQEALEAEALVTRRSAVTMSAFIAVACLLGILNSPEAERPLLLARVLSVALAIASIGILAAQRKRPQLWMARAAFAVVPIPLFPTFWLLRRRANRPRLAPGDVRAPGAHVHPLRLCDPTLRRNQPRGHRRLHDRQLGPARTIAPHSPLLAYRAGNRGLFLPMDRVLPCSPCMEHTASGKKSR